MSKIPLTATDWRAIQRIDDSIYLECGSGTGPYHMAFNIAIEDINLAQRFAMAMNVYNEGVE
jgi:hypothetical protein